jgi:YVTN family beta-propeller protein
MNTFARTVRHAAWLALFCSAAVAAATRIYVTNERSGELSVIDGTSNSVVRTVKLGKRPRGVQLAPDGEHLYVALSGSPIGGPNIDESKLPPADKQADGIGVVDLATLRLDRVLRGVSDPEQLAVGPDGRRLYVASEDTGQAIVLDAQTGHVLHELPVGHEPEGIGLAPGGRWIYVASEADDTITVIDTAHDTVVGSIKVGERPRGIVFGHNDAVAYVSCENDGTVSVIDTGRRIVTRTLALPVEAARPMGLALSPDDGTLYVATGRAGKVVAIDTRTGQARGTVAVGERPWGLSLSADGRFLYTANGPSNDVTVVDTANLAVVTRIAVGASPWATLAVSNPKATTVATTGR